jgi:hypothetical protein
MKYISTTITTTGLEDRKKEGKDPKTNFWERKIIASKIEKDDLPVQVCDVSTTYCPS